MGNILADVILLIHFAFVLFVAGGWILILMGGWRGWLWVRNFRFRVAHLEAIAFVAFEAAIGMVCPLTEWEYQLRGAPSNGPGFIERYVSNLLYYDAPAGVFILCYIDFALIVALTWRIIPPRRNIESKEVV